MVRIPAPMLATAGSPPVPSSAWDYEAKWDGQRAIFRCDNGDCRIFSRNLREITLSYPDLSSVVAERCRGLGEVLLDGEIVALVGQRPSFGRLQRRMHARPTAGLIAEIPAHFIAFDLLAAEGLSTMGHTYLERRNLLEGLGLHGGVVHVPPYWTDTDPRQLLAAVEDAFLEGLVSKKLDSVYRSGRSRSWIKSSIRKTTEAIIVGWLAPRNGVRDRAVGSLILAGYNDFGELEYIGSVGAGITTVAGRLLRKTFDRLARPDAPLHLGLPKDVAAQANWLTAALVADVEYREVTEDGLIRHPSFRGIRADVPIDHVRRPAR
ncbi:ATP-dependent DNA ligase [Nocardia terpenica]|uniref:DNA ligase (ATP) n=1 Tax=Nocardia terpenica TaxID=455432 RepID=A0A6G9ZDU7_9NOCA|nr:ATP-dependent DNA ligase [Nocardia terpenica]QIS23692.1 ATP-dependent DNA ligase [Nocardia terpenica]